MTFIPRAVGQIARLLNRLAGCCLVGMTALTCADVIMRSLRMPIPGTYELIGFLGAAVAAFAMAHTTLHRGHVAVEVLVANLGAKARLAVYLSTQILGGFLFILIAYECFNYGGHLRAAGEVSLTLNLPFYPVLYGISLSSAVVCMVLSVDFFRVAFGVSRPWYRWQD